MQDLPIDLWHQILEIGTKTRGLDCKDLCSLAIANPRLNELSKDPVFWARFLARDFPVSEGSTQPPLAAHYRAGFFGNNYRISRFSTHHPSKTLDRAQPPPSKALYRAKFEGETRIRYARKLKATLETIEKNFHVNYPEGWTRYNDHKKLLLEELKEERALWVVHKLVQSRIDPYKWTIEVVDTISRDQKELGRIQSSYKTCLDSTYSVRHTYPDPLLWYLLYEYRQWNCSSSSCPFTSPFTELEASTNIDNGIAQVHLGQEEEPKEDKLSLRQNKEAISKRNSYSQALTQKKNSYSQAYIHRAKPPRRSMPRKT